MLRVSWTRNKSSDISFADLSTDDPGMPDCMTSVTGYPGIRLMVPKSKRSYKISLARPSVTQVRLENQFIPILNSIACLTTDHGVAGSIPGTYTNFKNVD